jgi:hypothetical protein|eukprot:CAMPEP_0174291052 /NCGR_PEP_ID=MMETSP0809-20121228/30923_1 /TAXON_ID=73025 ORGANISM="Eutreptiella gymnastica-like, Strain CCMP1594" /NCGR_SAMPLE_ID=MMETSP0809 /ASSEMBLY_ACC=CAM_ASM_000658 /LENGTH=41 /DNA_ID= /DNA_START= /DNA_END= /DNA_ORIENTATION=
MSKFADSAAAAAASETPKPFASVPKACYFMSERLYFAKSFK